jgi:hypothetical protein
MITSGRGPCKICHLDGAEITASDIERIYECARCGRFCITEHENWVVVERGHRIALSAWVYEQNGTGGKALITAELSEKLANFRRPGLPERANRALCVFARCYPTLIGAVSIGQAAKNTELQVASYSADEDEALVLLHVLIAEELLEGIVDSTSNQIQAVRLKARGLIAAENMGRSGSNSPQGFVAMSFDPKLRDVWTNGFFPAIEAAGYRPMRIDQKDYVGGISDEVLAEIRQSRFVVVDYTLQRNNVYFEAGFALGLGLTIIPTCRSDEASRLEFDIRHMNTLTWTDSEDLANRLSIRIRAVIGAGPNVVE